MQRRAGTGLVNPLLGLDVIDLVSERVGVNRPVIDKSGTVVVLTRVVSAFHRIAVVPQPGNSPRRRGGRPYSGA